MLHPQVTQQQSIKICDEWLCVQYQSHVMRHCLALVWQQSMCVERIRLLLYRSLLQPITAQTNSQRRLPQWQVAHGSLIQKWWRQLKYTSPCIFSSQDDWYSDQKGLGRYVWSSLSRFICAAKHLSSEHCCLWAWGSCGKPQQSWRHDAFSCGVLPTSAPAVRAINH